ncbi:MAG: MXAN_2562 family outer membrane beta-barrel protein [Proteobacteria bacterium]|nr:MXAN_2562 family outer membrane beta-barrel protein [Pseudomonadota bacterium]
MVLIVFILSGIGIFWPFASAQAESKKSASFSLRFGPLRPDKVAAGGITWRNVYGGGNSLFSGAEWEKEILQKYGVLAIGGEAGWIQASGKSLMGNNPGARSSGESIEFQIAPIGLNLTYRLMYFKNQFLVPFGRAGLDIYLFRERKEGDTTISGYRTGYHYAFGGAFLLDWLSPESGVNLDLEWGINNTYLIFEYRYSHINDFNKKHDFDFSTETWFGGIMFEY